MPSQTREKDPIKCWNLLARVLSYGHTIPFYYKKTPQRYILSNGFGWGAYHDETSEEYLLEDIKHALCDEGIPFIQLHLSGISDGPITDVWTFKFTKEGLVEAESYYNDD